MTPEEEMIRSLIATLPDSDAKDLIDDFVREFGAKLRDLPADRHFDALVWVYRRVPYIPVPSRPHRVVDPDTSVAAGSAKGKDDVGQFRLNTDWGQMMMTYGDDPLTDREAARLMLEADPIIRTAEELQVEVESKRRRGTDLRAVGYIVWTGTTRRDTGVSRSAKLSVRTLLGRVIQRNLEETDWARGRPSPPIII